MTGWRRKGKEGDDRRARGAARRGGERVRATRAAADGWALAVRRGECGPVGGKRKRVGDRLAGAAVLGRGSCWARAEGWAAGREVGLGWEVGFGFVFYLPFSFLFLLQIKFEF